MLAQMRSRMYCLMFVFALLPFHTANAQPIQTAVPEVLPENISHSCGCVAFRLDDVQDYFTKNAQIDLIKMFGEESVPLTIGVIGGFLGEDAELVSFLQSVDTGLVEFGNHGWNHTDHSEMTLADQIVSMSKTNELIQDLFGVEAKTFIPPENAFDEDTLAAMEATALTHMSGSIFLKPDEPPYPLKNGDSVYHFPQTAYVSDVDTPTGVWTIFPNSEVMDAIDSSVEQYGFAVVVMHAVAHYERRGADYVYKPESLRSVRELIQMVKNKYEVVKLGEIELQNWIPKDFTIETPIHIFSIPDSGGITVGATQSDLSIDVSDGSLLVDRLGEAWAGPLLILIPEDLAPQEPVLTAAGRTVPTMDWFDPQSNTWIVYLDPKASNSSFKLDVNAVIGSGPNLDPMFLLLLLLPLLLVIFVYGKYLRKRRRVSSL
jgi:peptidoglycan/xylan/chitin deacetylase (PgdA/CDA1 family)